MDLIVSPINFTQYCVPPINFVALLGLVHMMSKKCPNPTNLIQIWLKTHYFYSNLQQNNNPRRSKI